MLIILVSYIIVSLFIVNMTDYYRLLYDFGFLSSWEGGGSRFEEPTIIFIQVIIMPAIAAPLNNNYTNLSGGAERIRAINSEVKLP